MPSGPMNRYRERNFNIEEKSKGYNRPSHSLLAPPLNPLLLTITNQKNPEKEGGLKMKIKNKCPATILLLLIFVTGCVSMGRGKIILREDLILNEYVKIRRIIIEEAANNGFPTLKSEVKPLEINRWEGKLYFTLKTQAGWDNLTAKIKRKGDKFEIELIGAATVANPKGAVEAIKARLSEL